MSNGKPQQRTLFRRLFSPAIFSFLLSGLFFSALTPVAGYLYGVGSPRALLISRLSTAAFVGMLVLAAVLLALLWIGIFPRNPDAGTHVKQAMKHVVFSLRVIYLGAALTCASIAFIICVDLLIRDQRLQDALLNMFPPALALIALGLSFLMRSRT
jgi:hypothetical protein